MISRHLVIMAKAPVLGRIKTRLARDIGAVAATGFYRGQLARLLRRVGRDLRWNTVVAVSPDACVDWPVWPVDVGRIPQGPGDLGARMDRAVRAMPPGAVIVVGCDIPELGPARIAEAFRALGDADVVAGPTEDGGYYLIGFRRVPAMPDAFAGVRWSGPHALSDTLANLDRWKVACLPVLADIDTGDDWSRWRERLRTGRGGLTDQKPQRAGDRSG